MTPIERKARELLPCPFCGTGDPYVMGPTCKRSDPYNPADRLFPTVRCRGCFVEATGKDGDFSCSSAITAWNRRAPDQATEALRAERDAAFRMSRCECASDECCANLVKHQQRAERLAEALRDAATSMQTIADKAGRDEYLMTMDEVRGYANSRANAALAALHPQEADNG